MRMWDPFGDMDARMRELDTIRRELDRVIGGQPGVGTVAFLPGRAARNYPLINLSEDRENFYVEALAPGINPESLNLTVVRNTLTLSGEKPAPEGVAPEAFHRSERAAGKFVRSVELPTEVDSSKVQAQYVDGLLNVTLPKAAAAKPKQIRVAIE